MPGRGLQIHNLKNLVAGKKFVHTQPSRSRLHAFRDHLRVRLLQEGAQQHRSNLLVELHRQRVANDVEAIAMVAHLLYERLMFSHKHFVIAMSSLGRRHLWQAACGLLDEMPKYGLRANTVCYNAALAACSKGHAWRNCLALLEEMQKRSAEADVISFSTVLTACQRSSMWETALSVFQQVNHSGLRPDTRLVNAVISCMARAKQWQGALEFFEAMGMYDVSTDLYCQNTLLSAFDKGGKWELVLKQMSFLLSSQTKLSPNVVSFTTAIRACYSVQQWDKALYLFQTMEEQSTKPSRQVYNTVIIACSHSCNQLSNALMLMGAMHGHSYQPSTAACNQVIEACATRKHWQGALGVLRQMQTQHVAPNVATYAHAMAALHASNHLDSALALHSEAEKIGLLSSRYLPDKKIMYLHEGWLKASLVAVHAVLLDTLHQPSGKQCHNPSKDLIFLLGHDSKTSSHILPMLKEFFVEEFEPPLDLKPDINDGRPRPNCWILPAESLQRWVSFNRASSEPGKG